MNMPTRFRSTLLFLGLPVLWLGSFSATGQFNSSAQQAANFDFIPVAVHASHSANYSVDESNDKFAPVDEDIVIDARNDQGLTPTVPVVIPDAQSGPTSIDEDQPEAHRGIQPDASPPPAGSSQGGGQDDEDPGQSGEDHGQDEEDNGNKDKGEDSPGQSGEDHGQDKEDNGSEDKGEDSPGHSGDEHGGGQPEAKEDKLDKPPKVK